MDHIKVNISEIGRTPCGSYMRMYTYHMYIVQNNGAILDYKT